MAQVLDGFVASEEDGGDGRAGQEIDKKKLPRKSSHVPLVPFGILENTVGNEQAAKHDFVKTRGNGQK